MTLYIVTRNRKTGEDSKQSFTITDGDQAMEIIGKIASKKAPIISAYVVTTFEAETEPDPRSEYNYFCRMCGNEWKPINEKGFCWSCWSVWNS